MALIAGDAHTGTGLAGAIYAELQTLTYFQAGEAGEAFANKLATAIVTELLASVVVVPTLLVAPPGGGPVTGTGSLT